MHWTRTYYDGENYLITSKLTFCSATDSKEQPAVCLCCQKKCTLVATVIILSNYKYRGQIQSTLSILSSLNEECDFVSYYWHDIN